jgi:hypothetical protein
MQLTSESLTFTLPVHIALAAAVDSLVAMSSPLGFASTSQRSP